MMFKRPRLRPARPLVNVGLAASLIFICACSGDKPAEETENASTGAPEVVVETAERPPLQAVWSTNGLSAEILDVAVAGGPNPILATVMDGGQMQLFDLDGAQLTEPAAIGVIALADGHPTNLAETSVTLFPGISDKGDLTIYLSSPQLEAPAAIALPTRIAAAGLCAGPANSEDALLQVAYWTQSAPDQLITGSLYEEGGEFVWDETSNRPLEAVLSGCTFVENSDKIFSPVIGTGDLAVIGTSANQTILQLGPNGDLQEVRANGETAALTVRPGISIGVPRPIVSFAALVDAQFGGYPNGVIIIAGESNDAQRLVFVEPIGLFDD